MIQGRIVIDTSGIAGVVTEAKKRNITLKGAKAAAKILLVAARAQAPRRRGSGALRQAQGIKAVKGRKGTTISFAVQGARTKVVKVVRLPGRKTPKKATPALYDHLVQLGTKPHKIGKGRHPGTAANPYRRRAWEGVKGAAADACLDAMGAATRKEIERQSAKVKAKAAGAK